MSSQTEQIDLLRKKLNVSEDSNLLYLWYGTNRTNPGKPRYCGFSIEAVKVWLKHPLPTVKNHVLITAWAHHGSLGQDRSGQLSLPEGISPSFLLYRSDEVRMDLREIANHRSSYSHLLEEQIKPAIRIVDIERRKKSAYGVFFDIAGDEDRYLQEFCYKATIEALPIVDAWTELIINNFTDSPSNPASDDRPDTDVSMWL